MSHIILYYFDETAIFNVTRILREPQL